MYAVTRRPEDRPPLQRQRAADREKVFERFRHGVRTVRVEAVIPHSDPPADADPVQDERDDDRLPCREEGRGHGEGMKATTTIIVSQLALCRSPKVISLAVKCVSSWNGP